ncbi:MAG: Holliday junction branch migration protein RuvA [Gammaproteobacteria bacterium HGW-Gammaproteobacteria-14]|nr:MAG: Holliday junction branch migration protein RuvA [Gammaproteobacteria bacterium HGW-Gammaproteobacteria-14]
MIGQLRGTLMDKRAPWLLLDVAGVGYEVEAPMTVFYQLPDVGAEVLLHTHFVVREDAQLLYGFCSRFERELFRALIRVNGVGPKLALAILSGMEADRLVRCIESQDSSTLVKIPGVGKKTADRLLIEMSDRLAKLDGVPPSLPGLAVSSPADATSDAVAALESLGYRPRDAQAAVAKVAGAADVGDEVSSETLIRLALKSLAR